MIDELLVRKYLQKEHMKDDEKNDDGQDAETGRREGLIDLGPVQITDKDNEWNKRALKIAAEKLLSTPTGTSQNE